MVQGSFNKKLPLDFQRLYEYRFTEYRSWHKYMWELSKNFELCNAKLETIKKILTCQDASKAPSLDETSSNFLKDRAEVLALPLCNLVNLSITQSLLPDQGKIAKLKPLFKKKGLRRVTRKITDPTYCYLLSKILEKTIQIQVQENFDKNSLLYQYQSGFCAKFSRDYSLVQLTDFILRRMDKGFHTGMILFDLNY